MTSTLQSLKIAAEKLQNKYTLTPLECALRDATNNENWATDTKILQEISDATYNYNDFNVITKYIWEKLASKSQNWKKIIKTLNLIEYLLQNGAPRCINEFKDELFQIRQLQDYQLFQEGIDRGEGIKQQASRLVELLTDETKLEQERELAKQIRERLAGTGIIHNESVSKYQGFSNKNFTNDKQSPTKDYIPQATTGHYDETNFTGNLDQFRQKQEKEKEQDVVRKPSPPQKVEEKPKPISTDAVFRIPQPGEEGDVSVFHVQVKSEATYNPNYYKPNVAANSLIDFDEIKPNPTTKPVVQAPKKQQDPFTDWNNVKTALPPATNNAPQNSEWGWDNAPAPKAPAPVVSQPNLFPNPTPAPVPVNNNNFNFFPPAPVQTFPNQTPLNLFPTNNAIPTNNFPPNFNAAPVNNNLNTFNYNQAPVVNNNSFNLYQAPAPSTNNNVQFNFSTNTTVAPPKQNTQSNTGVKKSDDEFSFFQSAGSKEPEQIHGLSQKEAKMIDLSNLKKEDNQQKDDKSGNTQQITGFQNQEEMGSNLLFTTQEDLDSFSVFGSPTKPVNPIHPINQTSNYNALYTPQVNTFNQPNMMMYPNPNPGMGGYPMNNMGYNNMGGVGNVPQYPMMAPGGGYNTGFPNQQGYNNNNAFNFQ